jgi:hypothetical protein
MERARASANNRRCSSICTTARLEVGNVVGGLVCKHRQSDSVGDSVMHEVPSSDQGGSHIEIVSAAGWSGWRGEGILCLADHDCLTRKPLPGHPNSWNVHVPLQTTDAAVQFAIQAP